MLSLESILKTQQKKRALEVLSFVKTVATFSAKQIEKLDLPEEMCKILKERL